jgi:hypothetical protein
MMIAARTSETLVNFYQTTRRYNPEDSHLHPHNGHLILSVTKTKGDDMGGACGRYEEQIKFWECWEVAGTVSINVKIKIYETVILSVAL